MGVEGGCMGVEGGCLWRKKEVEVLGARCVLHIMVVIITVCYYK